MQLSTRGRYAVTAMADLARREACPDCPRPVTLADIAQAQSLSLCYLEQLFGGLRRAGLVTSVRGPGGGYRLAVPAEDITVAAIMLAADEELRATRCHDGAPGCPSGGGASGGEGKCLTHDLWHELGQQIQMFLEGVTLADIVGGRVCGRARCPSGAAGGVRAGRMIAAE